MLNGHLNSAVNMSQCHKDHNRGNLRILAKQTARQCQLCSNWEPSSGPFKFRVILLTALVARTRLALMSIRIIWQLVSLHSEFEKMKRKSIWRPQLCRVWILVQCGDTGHCLGSPSPFSAHWAFRWKILPHQELETSEIFRIYIV